MSSSTIEILIQKAVSLILNVSPNTLVTHLMMEQFVQDERRRHKTQYYARVHMLKTALKVDHGIFLKTVHKQGYVLVKGGGEIDCCIVNALRGMRTMVKASADTNYIKVNEIADLTERNKAIQGSQTLGNIAHMLSKSTPQIAAP